MHHKILPTSTVRSECRLVRRIRFVIKARRMNTSLHFSSIFIWEVKRPVRICCLWDSTSKVIDTELLVYFPYFSCKIHSHSKSLIHCYLYFRHYKVHSTLYCIFDLQVFSEPTTTSSTMRWSRATTNQPLDWPSLWTPGRLLVIRNAKYSQMSRRSPSARRQNTSSYAELCSRTRILRLVASIQSWTPSPSSRRASSITGNATLAHLKTWSTVTQLLLTSSLLDCEEYGPSICPSVVSGEDGYLYKYSAGINLYSAGCYESNQGLASPTLTILVFVCKQTNKETNILIKNRRHGLWREHAKKTRRREWNCCAYFWRALNSTCEHIWFRQTFSILELHSLKQ